MLKYLSPKALIVNAHSSKPAILYEHRMDHLCYLRDWRVKAFWS